ARQRMSGESSSSAEKIAASCASLLPLFPGLHTHQRALDAGMRIAGCTVHFVTEGMEEGPVIGQAAVPVLSGDTADSLAAR
ncbi:phosphoribosylglycinamide formyltransferase, partial [Rhizobium ruizarguesonis]